MSRNVIAEYDILRSDAGLPVLEKIREVEIPADYAKPENQFHIEVKMLILKENLKIANAIDEHLCCIALNGQNNILGVITLGIGNWEKVNDNIRRMGIFLLLTGASGFLVVHNHPNNICIPSLQDKATTQTYMELGSLLEIEFFGDYVITEDGYVNIQTDKAVLFSELDEDAEI